MTLIKYFYSNFIVVKKKRKNPLRFVFRFDQIDLTSETLVHYITGKKNLKNNLETSDGPYYNLVENKFKIGITSVL